MNNMMERMDLLSRCLEWFKVLIVSDRRKGNFNTSTSFTLLSISFKYSGYFAFIPSNFDLDKHIERFPLTDYKFVEINGKISTINDNDTVGFYFDKDRMLHILDLLSLIPASNKDLISEEGFVSINATILSNYFKDYLSYLDYLIETGVIISDGHYEVGVKSIGYKLAPEYENAELTTIYYKGFDSNKVQPFEQTVYNKISKKFQPNTLLNYPYLTHWYGQKKLSIDAVKAIKYAHLLKEKKWNLGYEQWDVNKNKWSKKRNDFCRKYPKTQYKAIIHNIKSIEIGYYKAKIDTTVHRQHSVLTNMQKDFRNFITYDGQELVSIDVSNSQPYLMCLLFNPEFWKENSTLPLNITNISSNIKAIINPSLLIMIGYYVDNLEEEKLATYKRKTSLGLMYEYIRDRANEHFGTSLVRDDIKTMLFMVFFSKNGYFNQKGAELKRLFAELFPEIYGLIELIKSENHAAFAILLQSIESEIILHRCCKRIWEEGNGKIPIFTIHDSIVTTKENVEFVERIMQEELTQCIGIPPKFKREEWKESNLHHQDILTQINEHKSE